MEPATISALAALAGATIGGVTSFAATWLTQRTQARIQAITHKLSRREELYKPLLKKPQSYMRMPFSTRYLTSPSWLDSTP